MRQFFQIVYAAVSSANQSVGTVLIVGGLTFFPALALGPIAEHFAMAKGILYAAP